MCCKLFSKTSHSCKVGWIMFAIIRTFRQDFLNLRLETSTHDYIKDFRKILWLPKVGDIVYFNKEEETIEKIDKRKNELVRPPLANIDNVFIVSAIKNPKVNFLLLDKMIINSLINKIKVHLIFNKIDLSNEKQIEEIKEMYSMYPLFFTSAKEGLNIDSIYPYLKGKTNVFTGVSGVG